MGSDGGWERQREKGNEQWAEDREPPSYFCSTNILRAGHVLSA